MTEPQQRIAIVGGNFAGLTAAIKLSPRHAVLPLRSVADVLAIKRRLQTLQRQGRPLRLVIAGGGDCDEQLLRREQRATAAALEGCWHLNSGAPGPASA